MLISIQIWIRWDRCTSKDLLSKMSNNCNKKKARKIKRSIRGMKDLSLQFALIPFVGALAPMAQMQMSQEKKC